MLSGEVQENSETPGDSLQLNTTPSQEKAINDYIDKMYNNPGDYALYPANDDANSCATFVYNALKAAGLNVKYSGRPKKLFHNIKKALRTIQIKNKPNASTSSGGESNGGLLSGFKSGLLEGFSGIPVFTGTATNIVPRGEVTVIDHGGYSFGGSSGLSSTGSGSGEDYEE